MKYSITIVFIAALIFSNNVVYSQTVDSLYKVGTWHGFRQGAVSFTFDDGCSNQIPIALPMFDSHGFKMTFYPVINWYPNWTALQAAVSNGHEVGSHTVSHAKLSDITSDSQNTELKNSQIIINSHISGQHCITIAYPNCLVGDKTLCGNYYIAARGCSGVVEPSKPGDFMNISSFVCGTLGSVKTAQDFKNKADAAAASKGWVVFLLHGIDNDGGYSPVTSTDLQAALDSLSSHAEKYWVSTFSNVARYIRERNSVSVNEMSNVDSIITVSITDTLDDEIYNVPITIRRQLPQLWASAIATQNGLPIADTVVEIDSTKYIVFDAVPDGGSVNLMKADVVSSTTSQVSLLVNFMLNQNYPNPFNPSTTIRYEIPKTAYVKIIVYDVLGKVTDILVDGMRSPNRYRVEWTPSHLSSGIYFYRIYACSLDGSGNFTSVKKLIYIK